MEIEETEEKNVSNCEESHTACSAVNNLILDYYKKFGRKRDLEQFFSLSTAQSEVRDPCSLFWRRMKSQDESSDSGGKKSESSMELCRISIQCSIPDPSTSQVELSRVKSDSESPPIISEKVIPEGPAGHSDNESVKSDDVQSQKSIDGTLDISINKPHSPTSSINSQRKLEWDSLADVGYANESDRKNSASSLSTLERMALQQQYTNNDTKNSDIGHPTAQSTPFDANETKLKHKKSGVKKTTKIYKKDIESLELSIPQNADNSPQPINLNLTKHISFNVDRNGSVVIENVSKNVSLSPEKVSVETEVTPQIKMDKEIQTTLNRTQDKSRSSGEKEKDSAPQVKRYPVLISLNTLKKKTKKKKVRRIKRQQSKKKLIADKENVPLEKSGDQLSEAESFEYMPGHIYNQNQHMKYNQRKNNVADNKSSLESSGLTTDSSKTSKYSFAKDLEKSIDILKSALDQKYEDANLRKNLVKEIVRKLIESKYKGDKSSSEFLSGLSFNSQRLGLGDNNYTTTSTSDTNNTANETKPKPKKSILRMDKFNANPIASTSQSVPNIPIFTKNEKPVKLKNSKSIDLSNTDSDVPNKNKALSDIGVDKTSSEVLYKKYLEALKREQAYKRHLKDKEMFLKQKLVSSDVVHNAIRQVDVKAQNRIKDLMKDLIRNNYDDGSGDASKLEGGSSAYINTEKYNSLRKQKSHSVFTLSSGTSENRCKNVPVTNRHQNEAGSSKIDNKLEKHYCCCPLHAVYPKVRVTDSSVQVNIQTCRDHESPHRKIKGMFQQAEIPEIEQTQCEKCKSSRNRLQVASDNAKDDFKYVCLCTDDGVTSQEIPENFLIYKCSRLPSKNLKLEDIVSKVENTASGSSSNFTSPRQKISSFKSQDCEKKCLVIKDSTSSNNQTSKSSQTNINLPLVLRSTNSHQSISSTSTEHRDNVNDILGRQYKKPNIIHEVTRCIQTEISIDPKISDPSISDVNIVSDEMCVDLISERYKKVSQPIEKNDNIPFEKNCVQVQSSESSLPESKNKLQMGSDKCISTSAGEEFTFGQKLDKEVQSSPDHTADKNTNRFDDKQCSKNFTIPIQGTNMTLKVSLGSETNSPPFDDNILPKDIKTNKNFMSQGTETVKPPVTENSTSLQEECSKGVQSNNTNIFEEFYRKPPKSTVCESQNTRRDNFDSEVKNNEKANDAPESCYATAFVATKCKYNTYPTEDRSNIQKPLLRSNTDPSKIEKASHVTFHKKILKDMESQAEVAEVPQRQSKAISPKQQEKAASCSELSSKSMETSCKSKVSSDTDKQFKSTTTGSETDGNSKELRSKDPVLHIIQDITKRYSKNDIEKNKRKKCFKEIIKVLSYLLDTEESTDHDQNKASCSSAFCDVYDTGENLPDKESADSIPAKTLVDKAVQLSTKKSKSHKTCTESSNLPTSTDFPSTSSDAATCKVLNKIKRECEKYHQKRCKHTSGKKCEGSSSTSVNCDQCRRVHHCSCRGHKCKNHRTKTTLEKTKKKCVAYNLIIQTSDSLVSEEIDCGKNHRQLQNIIVKVPSKRKVENVPFKEMATKIEKNMPHCSPRNCRGSRSKSLPNDSEISSTDEVIRKAEDYTVREFLEKNRPDFIEKCSNRQDCLKLIKESRPRDGCPPGLNMIVVHPPTCNGNSCMETCNMCCGGLPISNCNACAYNSVHCIQNEVMKIANERKAKRQLLSLQLDRKQALNALSESDLKDFARALGDELRRKKVAPKFINEREMKKHSEKIYKSLPEVVQKKEEIKKENIKKTNLLMANIFRKNLQKKTLRGAINISNYSSVIKI